MGRGKLLILAGLLPVIYGCGTGAGELSALTGFLFGGGDGGSISSLASLGGGGGTALAGSSGIPAAHQPEPASMFLVGGGMAAMAYFRSRLQCKSKDKIAG